MKYEEVLQLINKLYPNEDVRRYMSAIIYKIKSEMTDVDVVSKYNRDSKIRKAGLLKLRRFIDNIFDEHVKCLPKLRSFYGEKSILELQDIIIVACAFAIVCNEDCGIDNIFTDERCLSFGITV